MIVVVFLVTILALHLVTVLMKVVVMNPYSIPGQVGLQISLPFFLSFFLATSSWVAKSIPIQSLVTAIHFLSCNFKLGFGFAWLLPIEPYNPWKVLSFAHALPGKAIFGFSALKKLTELRSRAAKSNFPQSSYTTTAQYMQDFSVSGNSYKLCEVLPQQHKVHQQVLGKNIVGFTKQTCTIKNHF